MMHSDITALRDRVDVATEAPRRWHWRRHLGSRRDRHPLRHGLQEELAWYPASGLLLRPTFRRHGGWPRAVLHAKAVVHDNEQVFVTSANLTPKALDRNIEAGVLIRDRPLAQAIASHFQRLIDTGLVVPLPPVG